MVCSLILNHNPELETDGVGAEREGQAQLLPAPSAGTPRAPGAVGASWERITWLKCVIPDGGYLDSRAVPSVLSPSPLHKWPYWDVEGL